MLSGNPVRVHRIKSMIDEEKEDLDLNQLFASIRQRHKRLAYLQNDVPALVAQLNDENPTAAQAAEEQLCDFRDALFDQEDDCYFFLDGTILEPGIAIDLNQILKVENFTELQKTVFWTLQEFFCCYKLGEHLDQILEFGLYDIEDDNFEDSEEEDSEFQEPSEEDQDLVVQEASAVLLTLLSLKKENGRLSDSAQGLANDIIQKFNLDVNPIFPDEKRH